MSDESVAGTRGGFGVTALKMTYQATLIDGKQLAFETAIDATADRETLDEFMDTFVGAAKRQQAIEELPLVRQSLRSNLATLADQVRGRERSIAEAQARQTAANGNRRNPREMGDGDKAAIVQFDQRISQVRTAISAAQARIPYLEALIARVPLADLPDPFPGANEEGAAQAA